MAVYDNKVLNGEHLSYLIGLIKTALSGKQPTIDGSHKLATNLIDTGNDASFVSSTEKSTWSGKQDALVFNTAYDASTNKVATMSDIPDVSGKQDALVFNSTYNATDNKVATMADIPSVAGFQTASDVSTAINTALGGLTTFHFEVVSALPQSNQDSSAIYLVPKSTSSTNNIYEEWAWVKTGTETNANEETVDVFGWEHIGDTQVDIASLSNTEIQTIWESVS